MICPAPRCVLGRGSQHMQPIPRLLQLRDSLERESEQSRRRQDRRRDLEELRKSIREAESASDPATSLNLAERAQALASKYSEDPEVASVASDLEKRLVGPARSPGFDDSMGAPSQVGNATMIFSRLAGRPRRRLQNRRWLPQPERQPIGIRSPLQGRPRSHRDFHSR